MIRGPAAPFAALLIAVSLAHAQAVAFKDKPVATRDGDKVRIAFSVTATTDVEVAVLDAAGKVARHLAAGVLGPNAPEPLRKGSLAQELTWDGKDDIGGVVAGFGVQGSGKAEGGTLNPLRIRVGLGLKPAFQRMIGENPASLGGVQAIATDPKDGALYVFHISGSIHPDDGSSTCTVFDRHGAYLRTIYPWPANTPNEKLAGVKRLDLEGRKIAFLYNGETRSLIPGLGNLIVNAPVVTTDGRLVFVGHQEMCSTITRYNNPGIKQATAIRTDGSIPAGSLLGPVLAKGSQAYITLALAPDEKTFYAAGVAEGYADKPKIQHAVHRFAWSDAAATPFVGDPAAAGGGTNRLSNPVSVAVDREGLVHVADRGNNRIAVFKPDGSYVGELAVDRPKHLAISRKTGAIYVVTGDPTSNALARYASWQAKESSLTGKLPRMRYPRNVQFALDDSGDRPVLWFASGEGRYGVPQFAVQRIEDQGTAFGPPVELTKLPENARPCAGPVMMLSLDRVHNRLFVNSRLCDPATGALTSSGVTIDGLKEGMGSVGLDGNLYLMGYPKWLKRFGADLKLLPFTQSADKNGVLQGPDGAGALRLRTRGVTADARGNIYALWQFDAKDGSAAGDQNRLTLHAPDGKVLNDRLIDCEIRPLTSPRLDYQGNIYVTLGVRPQGQDVPASFTGQDIGKPWKSRGMNTCDINWYHLMYGSVAKFGPKGGAVRKGTGGVPVTFSYGRETEVTGAQWLFYGASPVPSWRQDFPDTCLCESAQFDVDGYGRSFFPDAARFRVGILDTAGNLIAWVGEYGNLDSAGPASKLPAPEIPVLWPDEIAVGDGALYLGDRLNRRVVQVKLACAAEETVAVGN